ncbi:MAG: hypothetical protein WDO71_22690 [Bacteroidota bacterium]
MSASTPKKGIVKNILVVLGCIFVAGIVIAAVTDSGKTESPGADKETIQKNEPAVTSEAKAEEKTADTEKDAIITKLKAKAKRDWPDDYSTQEYWVNEQIESYEYMKTIADSDPIKKRARKDWPLDFSTQKYWYDEQIEAKERIQ